MNEIQQEQIMVMTNSGIVSLLNPSTWTYVEYGSFILLVLYGICWLRGKYKNKMMAQKIYQEGLIEALKRQFAVVTECESDGTSLCRVYATGRRNCSGVLLTLSLKPRQDLLSTYVLSYFIPSISLPDRISLIVNDLDEMHTEPQPFCASLCRRSLVKSMNEKFPELKLGKLRNYHVLDKAALPFVTISDFSEVVETLFGQSSPIGGLSREAASLIDYVVVDGLEPKRLTCEFRTTSGGEKNSFSILDGVVEALVKTIDVTVCIRLTDKLRKEAMDIRLKEENKKIQADAQEVRNERIMKKKADRKRQENERLSMLTPEQVRKEEEKIRRKEIRDAMKSRVKMVR